MDTAPAVCADMLARGDVEAALVPVIEYQRIPKLVIVPGVCVGSRAKVRSVVLVLREGLDDLREVRRVALDSSSRTSVALVQIIFREFLGFEPEWTIVAPDVAAMLKANDAALVIGDPSMTFLRDNVVVYDLAQLWREHTGLGFVFAMWMARDGHTGQIEGIDFVGARDEGVQHAEAIAEHYQNVVGFSCDEIQAYLRDNIAYELDDEMLEGLDLFYRLAHKHGLMPEVQPLRFIAA
ncbi:MAG: chorismate dehydratase [Acidobacteriota bacterium]|jgi:chorismate dehydratase|nr:chorismate dehydratase [Acidobacteriota bacterium]